jgi:hypothetical protein
MKQNRYALHVSYRLALQAAVNMTFDYLFTRPSYMQAGLNAIAHAFGVTPPIASRLGSRRSESDRKAEVVNDGLRRTHARAELGGGGGGSDSTLQQHPPSVVQPPTILVFNMVRFDSLQGGSYQRLGRTQYQVLCTLEAASGTGCARCQWHSLCVCTRSSVPAHHHMLQGIWIGDTISVKKAALIFGHFFR